MAYSDFSIQEIKKIFGLTETPISLFSKSEQIQPSSWLKEALETGLKLALLSSSEKARSEFIVAPILMELEKRNKDEFSIFSGERLDVDEEKGLKGECDFILSKGRAVSTIIAPIFMLVEAKKNDIKAGLGQCIAQMVGARLFNQGEGNAINLIYGCVTTGENWQFLKLDDDVVFMDIGRYYISELTKIIGVFQYIIDNYKTEKE